MNSYTILFYLYICVYSFFSRCLLVLLEISTIFYQKEDFI